MGVVSLMVATSFSACNNDDEGNPNADLYQLITNENADGSHDAEYKAILASYVDETVVPTYKAMAEAALEMRTANQSLKSGQSPSTITAAASAWMKARIAWEMSEAFLFGPVGENAFDIDGHIDSWPLEKALIDDELTKIENGATLDGKKVWKDMDAEVIGFHVTEYLLFRDGQPRASLTDAELTYLTAATDALVWDCVLAYVAWAGEENVSQDIKDVFNENSDVVARLNETPNYKNFAATLKNATGIYNGEINAALAEIATGAADIAGEVGATKIAAPYDDQKVEEVESWYSWHSLDDYQNNIRSIKNAYLGGMDDNSRKANSLSNFVARTHPDLNSQLNAQINDCLAKIKNIGKDGKSFYEVVRDQTNEAEVEAAVESCGRLENLFKKKS